MNTTSARSNSAASSPIESSSSTPGSASAAAIVVRRDEGTSRARFSFSATASNRSGLARRQDQQQSRALSA